MHDDDQIFRPLVNSLIFIGQNDHYRCSYSTSNLT